ncbi:unnamed protein product [Caenorhabditis bovis]|uniref:C2H2-type domain-containing protein n=1 Tax=Caenorhabditis bovis TaxID=2654633 RepID=A0A8S1EYP1_9PELO|nr:unnamed protein product [Caenorhabditis bovis]
MDVKKHIVIKLYNNPHRNQTLIKYLNKNCFAFFQADTYEDLLGYSLNTIFSQQKFESEPNTDEPDAHNVSNQDILETWANCENSQLLVSENLNDEGILILDDPIETTAKQESDITVDEEPVFKKLKPSEYSTTEACYSSSDEGVSMKKKIDTGMQDCGVCKKSVCVGKTRKTRIRRQIGHILLEHRNTLDMPDLERYHCQNCNRILPIQTSPCEHIKEHHNINKDVITFKDLWTTEQFRLVNDLLILCFDRAVPVPRGRRFNGTDEADNTPYVIDSEDGKLTIEPIFEKRTNPE